MIFELLMCVVIHSIGNIMAMFGTMMWVNGTSDRRIILRFIASFLTHQYFLINHIITTPHKSGPNNAP